MVTAGGPAEASGRAAFFDVDNTIVRGASMFLVAKGLHARGFFDTASLLRGVWYHLYYRLFGERQRHMDVARSSLLGFVAGRTVSDVEGATREIYDESIADRLWTGTVALARAHLAAGDQVWLVTAAPNEVAKVMVDRLGLTGALGTDVEAVDGVYTGRLRDGLLHGPLKAAAVRDLAARRGLDLASCHAYSDSANDLPLLESVGHPTAVNPDRSLRRRASRAGWPVHDFRTVRGLRRRRRAARPTSEVDPA